MYHHKNRKQNGTDFPVKQNQQPAKNYQNVRTKCQIKKSLWNIDVPMQGKFRQICIDAEKINQNYQSEDQVKIFIARKTSVC